METNPLYTPRVRGSGGGSGGGDGGGMAHGVEEKKGQGCSLGEADGAAASRDRDRYAAAAAAAAHAPTAPPRLVIDKWARAPRTYHARLTYAVVQVVHRQRTAAPRPEASRGPQPLTLCPTPSPLTPRPTPSSHQGRRLLGMEHGVDAHGHAVVVAFPRGPGSAPLPAEACGAIGLQDRILAIEGVGIDPRAPADSQQQVDVSSRPSPYNPRPHLTSKRALFGPHFRPYIIPILS